MTAQELIQKLELIPLPSEGGFYRETYRAHGEKIPARSFGIDAPTSRNFSTAIYFLIMPNDFSALHKVKSDEIFHFYGGDAAEMIQIDESGNLTTYLLGNNFANGEVPQIIVRRGVWQGLRLREGGSWALTGTTVAPGFEFEDFELGDRNQLTKSFPQHRESIFRYTRESDAKAL